MPSRPNKRKRKLEADEGRGGKKQDFVLREVKKEGVAIVAHLDTTERNAHTLQNPL